MILGKVMVLGCWGGGGGEVTIMIVWIGEVWRALQDYFVFYNMGPYTRKSVFRISDQVMPKSACSATESS